MYLGYVKVAITIVKYNPQVYLNFVSKSTEGMSVYSFVLDFTGGVFSLLQNGLDSYNYSDDAYVYGNIPKLAIGLVTLVYDSVLIFQHFALYRSGGKHRTVAPVVLYKPVDDKTRKPKHRWKTFGGGNNNGGGVDRFEGSSGGSSDCDTDHSNDDITNEQQQLHNVNYNNSNHKQLHHHNEQQAVGTTIIGNRSTVLSSSSSSQQKRAAETTTPSVGLHMPTCHKSVVIVDEHQAGRQSENNDACCGGGDFIGGGGSREDFVVVNDCVSSLKGSSCGVTTPVRTGGSRRSPRSVMGVSVKEDVVGGEFMRDDLMLRMPTMDFGKKRKSSD
eukprot:GHVS01052713.1.p2 GENE.GHVS01052713.1~~GHVS01052713.1.p2  ORF type:complete len:330 (+),score=82.47 GHVS01052713.1:1161-2150(+)